MYEHLSFMRRLPFGSILLSLEPNKQSNSGTDDLINIDNPYFESMVGRIYPHELLLNKANASDIESRPGSSVGKRWPIDLANRV